MAKTTFYVLVNSATEGMALYTELRKRGCEVRIAPSPRQETTCCGVSLMVAADQIDNVRRELEADSSLAYERIVEVELDINPARDKYC